MKRIFLILFSMVIILASCSEQPYPDLDRENYIPADKVKLTPADDNFIPVMMSDEWNDPVPLEGTVNTAGAEDSPFITDDGRFFFFFTPDAQIPAEQQLTDSVTGIWWCTVDNGIWSEPKRVILNDDVALDGCSFVQGDTLWFGSVRAGNLGEIDIYRAYYNGSKWTDVENAGSKLNVDYDIGELHITSDGSQMYYGKYINSQYDIYMLTRSGNDWINPVAVENASSSSTDENLPFITDDGNELWFTGPSVHGYTGPATFRCLMTDSGWGEPEEIIGNFAGEPCLDSEGNIYFVHHYFDLDIGILEADIYFAEKK